MRLADKVSILGDLALRFAMRATKYPSRHTQSHMRPPIPLVVNVECAPRLTTTHASTVFPLV